MFFFPVVNSFLSSVYPMYGDFVIIRGSYNDFLVVVGNNDIEMSRQKTRSTNNAEISSLIHEALEICHKRLDYNLGLLIPFYVGFLMSSVFFFRFQTGGSRRSPMRRFTSEVFFSKEPVVLVSMPWSPWVSSRPSPVLPNPGKKW